MSESDGFSQVEWIARTDSVGVRVNTLGPGRATPWHFHGEVTDTVVFLDEGIEVGLRAPDRTAPLRPGEIQRIPPRRVHRIANRSERPARYLLVQATGRYDFQEVPDPVTP